jgi:hypothetical protein
MKECEGQKMIKQKCSVFGFQAIEFLIQRFAHAEKY